MSFSRATSAHSMGCTHDGSLAAPLAVLMLQGHVSIHVHVQQRAGNSSLSEPIGSHVTSVKPEQVLKNKLVQKLPQVLNMAKKRLLGRLFDEGG